MKRLQKYFFHSVIIAALVLMSINVFVVWVVRGTTTDQVDNLPQNTAGLVLGTSKYSQGRINLYYKYRIDAAEELYKSGKVKKLIVSGDNRAVNYNEPLKMENDLIARGIPEEDIQPDYAGFRTLDSVVRAKEVFGQERVTVISQEFHNHRAIFIAKSRGVDAVGYNARDPFPSWLSQTHIREIFARVKLVWDITTGKDATVLGDEINL